MSGSSGFRRRSTRGWVVAGANMVRRRIGPPGNAGASPTDAAAGEPANELPGSANETGAGLRPTNRAPRPVPHAGGTSSVSPGSFGVSRRRRRPEHVGHGRSETTSLPGVFRTRMATVDLSSRVHPKIAVRVRAHRTARRAAVSFSPRRGLARASGGRGMTAAGDSSRLLAGATPPRPAGAVGPCPSRGTRCPRRWFRR